jgi:hypothetical protein
MGLDTLSVLCICRLREEIYLNTNRLLYDITDLLTIKLCRYVRYIATL